MKFKFLLIILLAKLSAYGQEGIVVDTAKGNVFIRSQYNSNYYPPVITDVAALTSVARNNINYIFVQDLNRGGAFVYQSTLDMANGGTAFPAAGGGFWVRQATVITLEMFGGIGDGIIDNTIAFNKAFSYLQRVGGGTVKLNSKTYVGTIDIPSNCGLEGTGRATVLKLPNSSNRAVIQLSEPGNRNVKINNLSIDGNKKNQTSTAAIGIYINGGLISKSENIIETNDARHVFQDIFIRNTKGTGFYLAGRGETNVRNVSVLNADSYGFYIASFDNTFSDLSSGANMKTGIYISSNNCRFNNCKSWNNGTSSNQNNVDGFGYWVDNCEGVIFSSCEAQSNYNHGFHINGSKDIILTGVNSEQNGVASTTTTCGYSLDSSKNCTIVGGVRNGGSINQDWAVGLYNYSDNNNLIISNYQMIQGALHDPQNRTSNNIQIYGDKQVRRVQLDHLNIGNNGFINTALSRFQLTSTSLNEIVPAIILRTTSTPTKQDELFRWVATNGETSHSISIKHTLNTGTTEIATTGSMIAIPNAVRTGVLTTQVNSFTANPTINNIPTNFASVWKNTVTEHTSLWYNDAGKMIPLNYKFGTATFKSDGKTVIFNIMHNLDHIPTDFSITPRSKAASGGWYVSKLSSSFIEITLTSMLSIDSGDIVFQWQAK